MGLAIPRNFRPVLKKLIHADSSCNSACTDLHFLELAFFYFSKIKPKGVPGWISTYRKCNLIEIQFFFFFFFLIASEVSNCSLEFQQTSTEYVSPFSWSPWLSVKIFPYTFTLHIDILDQPCWRLRNVRARSLSVNYHQIYWTRSKNIFFLYFKAFLIL